ncbi:MAG: peptidoglycan D,D-transpeptidase FtsI family protein [Patescibacteria group bacterium]
MWKRGLKKNREIYPDEIFVDSANPCGLDLNQMEGKIEKPISSRAFWGVGFAFICIATIFISKAWALQVVEGSQYTAISEENRFRYVPILSERGFLYSNDEEELAWNEVNEEDDLRRKYTEKEGFSHLLGYSKPPKKDSSGNYYRERYVGVDGVEEIFDKKLTGENGLVFIEHDAQGAVLSENYLKNPRSGDNIELSVDSEMQEAMYSFLKEVAEDNDFKGGAGLIMDIETGELIVATSFPEYDSSILSEGQDEDAIQGFVEDERSPFMNRFADTAFTPGSVVKPFVAAGALEEGVVEVEERLDSPLTISIPNPWDPSRPTVFRDWRSHGSVNFHEALAVSSNVYFYKVGGGYKDMEGLGISRIEEYMNIFGLGEKTGSNLSEASGNIPTPIWKHENFEDGVWRVGDTYNTSIGQFGFRLTPLQLVRGIASIANGGYLLHPVIVSEEEAVKEKISVSSDTLSEVREGMRMAVTEGTATGLSVPFLEVAAKTGTAQIGAGNKYMNSWIVGFFPYEEPKYAFTVVLDEGPAGTLMGGVYVMNKMLYWMRDNAPEYIGGDEDAALRD